MIEKWLLLQVQVAIMVLVILVLRQCMKKLPKVYSYALWLLVFVRLLCPVTLESRVSLIPSGQEWSALFTSLEERTGLDIAEGREGVAEETELMDAFAGTGQAGTDNSANQPIGTDKSENQPGAVGAVTYPEQSVLEALNTNQPGEAGAATGIDQAVGGGTGININAADGTGSAIGIEQSGTNGIIPGNQRFLAVLIPVIMLFGTIGILLYNMIALLRIRRRLKMAVWQEENIFISDRIETPFVTGFLKPRIYLPAFLGPKEQKYVLFHEQVHIKRKDYLVKNIAFLLTALYWYNPFVWVSFLLMGQDMEMSCDETVVRKLGEGIKKQYSQSLLNFAIGKNGMPVTPLPFGENSVKQRVKNILSYKKAKTWGCVAGAVVILIAGITLLTTRGPERETLVSSQETENAQETQVSENSQDDGAASTPAPAADTDEESAGTKIDRSSAELVLGRWAEAFSDRDGDLLYELSLDKDNFQKWDMVYPLEEGGYAFGASSPWPWMHGYEIQYEQGGTEAVIRYFMNSSEPAITIGREMVEVVKEGEEYYINHKDFQMFDDIKNAEEFALAYEEGYPNMRQYAAVINRHLIDGIDDAYYSGYKDPVSAAKTILHLGEGTGEVKYRMAATREDGMTAMVTYTFAQDGSRVEIPMQMAEPVQPIWMVDDGNGDVFQIFQELSERELSGSDTGSEDVVYQVTSLGIYQKASGEVECLYPYFAGTDPRMCLYDQRLLFMTDLNYTEGNLDWAENGICWINIFSEEYGVLDLAGYDNDRLIGSFFVGDGYIRIYFQGSNADRTYLMPDTGKIIRNGMTAEEMFPEQADEYGLALSENLLQEKGDLRNIAYHTAVETYAYLDMDQDGNTEKIVLCPYDNNSASGYTILDHFKLTIGDAVLEGYGENICNDIWAISLDGESLLLVLYEDGPSGDPYTTFYRYQDGKIEEAGSFGDDIRACVIGTDGVISGSIRCDIMQTNRIYVKWQQNAEGNIEQMPQDIYEFAYVFDVELKTDLPVYKEPGSRESFTITPQTVRLVQVTSDYGWVQLETLNGEKGWFKVEGIGTVTDLDKDATSVFDGLQFYD
ncbi:MAG: M56 family metallopeptidase [Lachnospiraceae bacterium]